MLSEYLSLARVIPQADINETFDSVKLKVKLSDSMSDFVLKLFDELKTLSSRDRFELFFEVSGNHVKITDCSSGSLKRIKDHLAEFQDESEFEIELNIEKTKVDSVISIYFLKEFGRYLTSEKLLDLINTISSKVEHQLILEVFSTIDCFGTACIQFYQAGSAVINPADITESSRQKKLELFGENATAANINIKLLPSDFYLTTQSEYQSINDFFRKACSVLSVIFLSNSSELRSNDELKYKINGYRAVICDGVAPDELSNKYELLHKIYAWAYEGGNNSDKLGLVRNVISIHLDIDGNIKIDNDVWEAIQSNYQIYLKGNIQSYLEVKNKIGELIIESTSKTYAMADELLDALKNNAFILLTFILTVVVVNGLKDTGETNVFSNAYLAIVVLLSVISAIWLLMTRIEVMNRYDSASSTISVVLNLNYNKILMESEIDECVKPVIKRNREYLESQAARYTKWWLGMLLVFVVSFGICNFVFKPSSELVKSNNATTSTSGHVEKAQQTNAARGQDATRALQVPRKNSVGTSKLGS